MVNSDIWTGSGATVSMIPEKDIYLGTFASIASSSSAGAIGSVSITTAGTQHTSAMTVITNAEIIAGQPASGTGGELLLTLSAHSTDFTFVTNDGSKYESGGGADGSIRIFADNGDGTATSIDVVFLDDSASAPSLGGNVTLSVDIAEDAEGEEIAEAVRIALNDSGEAITATRSGAVLTVLNSNGGFVSNSTETTNGGVSLSNTAGGAITNATVISGGSGFDLSAGGNVTITTAGTNGVITVALASSSTNQAVITPNSSFTTNFNLVANLYRGCFLSIRLDSDNTLQDRVLIQSNTATTLTVNDSLLPAITGTPGNYYGVIEGFGAPVPAFKNGSSNPRLLSDTWLGLTTSVTIPTTNVTKTGMNLVAGGTRNFIYQYAGIERTANGQITLDANSFWPLYYALGRITSIQSKNGNNLDTSASSSSITHAQLSDDRFSFTAGANTGFIYSVDEIDGGYILHRTDGTVICPPLPGTAVVTVTDGKFRQINKDDIENDFLVYTFAEENGQTLPTFALEYTLKKADQSSTVAVDSAKENVYTKIYPGSAINNLTINADAVGGPITMNMALNHKNTFVAPTNYEAANNKTDVKDFVNFRGRNGQTRSIAEDSNADYDALMQPFFFSDGTISIFGQDFLKIASFGLTINNNLTDQAYIGRFDKKSTNHITGQREYTMNFTAHVTDSKVFDELQSQKTTALSTSADEVITLRFTKDNGEELVLKFKDYVVNSASFPLNDNRGPITVDFVIQPLTLVECKLTTYWAIQA